MLVIAFYLSVKWHFHSFNSVGDEQNTCSNWYVILYVSCCENFVTFEPYISQVFQELARHCGANDMVLTRSQHDVCDGQSVGDTSKGCGLWPLGAAGCGRYWRRPHLSRTRVAIPWLLQLLRRKAAAIVSVYLDIYGPL